MIDRRERERKTERGSGRDRERKTRRDRDRERERKRELEKERERQIGSDYTIQHNDKILESSWMEEVDCDSIQILLSSLILFRILL